MNEFQYRANFVVQLLQSAVQVGTGLIVLGLIFDRTSDLNGWSRPQLLVVMGIFTLVGGLIGFWIEPNMGRVMSDVRLGTFDYVLTKPVDSQLLSSAREFRLWRLVDVLVGGVVMGWGIAGLPVAISAAEVALFLLMLIAGMTLIYCLWLIVTTGAFWFVRMEEVQELFSGLYRAGQYPVSVYPSWLRLILTYIVPIGVAVTVPAESLTGRLTPARVGIIAGFAVVALLLTRVVWKIGSRRYSGASA
jgi:ABC-2 type transport system permease protein